MTKKVVKEQLTVPSTPPMWHWLVFRALRDGTEKALAEGDEWTREGARVAAMEAEKPFPVSWLPETHYAVRDDSGQWHESPGVWWIPASAKERG